MSNKKENALSNTVLVVGGGIAGIKASLDLAEAGRKVYVIDSAPSPGGFLPLLDRQFPTNDCQICFLAPQMAATAQELDLEILPLTTLAGFSGEPGNFQAELVTQPRYIDTEKCNACGACLQAAPPGVVRFTPGLDQRSPTCMRYPQATPQAYSIDKSKLNGDTDWIKVCEPGAIDLEMGPSSRTVEVGSVVVATGARLFDPSPYAQHLLYGVDPDVVTSLEFERILSATGPTAGVFSRPSDGRRPQRIGWIQCVGSRTNQAPGKPYCSAICCMFAMKEAAWAKEHFADDLDATIFFMDMRPMGKQYEEYYQRVKNELGVNFVRCRPHTVGRDHESGDLLLDYVSEDGQATQAHLDMVVLATGFLAPADAQAQAKLLGVELDEHLFIKTADFEPVSTSRPGVYACGMSLGPRDIPDSLMSASAAAALASSQLAPPQALAREEGFPPERDLENQEPKVGVFLSPSGETARNPVDFDQLVSYLAARPDVAHVEKTEQLWTSAGVDHMVQVIKDQGLNRVVVAGPSPRSLSGLFSDGVRRAGLNPAYLEMANILEQDILVHASQPQVATAKAKDLLRMAVAAIKMARPVRTLKQAVNHDVLVVGGGVAGMSAALSLAGQGLKVHLLEREKNLGGMALKLKRALDGGQVAPKVAAMIQAVENHPNITLRTDALVVEHSGRLGAFTTGVQSGPGLYYEEIQHGVTILATGARQYEPQGYLYGDDPRVVTQLELEQILADGGGDHPLETVVMIQCVGSRNEKNPACGRVCCRSAVKNAMWLKELKPDARIMVLYRDMRMPYAAEEVYRLAREQGIIFVRYTQDAPPALKKDGQELTISFKDLILDRPISVHPDLVVLSVPQVADDEAAEELAAIFRLQKGPLGFLLEEHLKMKPVDSPVPGIYLAGSVLAPKSLGEAITQGQAAAGRALTVLAQHSLSLAGGVAKVTPELCAACLVCVRACPLGVPFINADGYSEIDPAKCQGCGVCAAECPAKAIELQGYRDDQIMARTDALLEGVL